LYILNTYLNIWTFSDTIGKLYFKINYRHIGKDNSTVDYVM